MGLSPFTRSGCSRSTVVCYFPGLALVCIERGWKTAIAAVRTLSRSYLQTCQRTPGNPVARSIRSTSSRYSDASLPARRHNAGRIVTSTNARCQSFGEINGDVAYRAARMGRSQSNVSWAYRYAENQSRSTASLTCSACALSCRHPVDGR
jgi:hypothetical protein